MADLGTNINFLAIFFGNIKLLGIFAKSYKQIQQFMVTKTSMRATIVAMDKGDVITISLSERGYNSIRNCASNVGVMMARKYSVSLNREANECKVTRIA